jgi:hypothetical protein
MLTLAHNVLTPAGDLERAHGRSHNVTSNQRLV